MPRDALTILCPAKVNLALSVGAPRAEDGRHPICSWMVAVGFYDTLTLTRFKDAQSSFNIHWGIDTPMPQTVDWPFSSDLAFRAHGLMQEHMKRELHVEAEVHKAIPTGAGLGGGSSDAAGMLTGLNELFSLGVRDEALIQLGLQLGSDVGFMVWSLLLMGPAIVSGTGERIEPVSAGDKTTTMVLILPPIQCPTAEVYRAFDQVAVEPGVDEERIRSLADASPLVPGALFNDLTDAAFKVQPTLREMRDQVREATGMPVHLSGSGSAMFIVVPSPDEGEALSKAITDQTGLAAICAGAFPE
jgi:4-diphosphocytidyl-2-C-methyl-D-erythritol kinase